MASVTARVSQISQPRGGYLKPTDFKEIVFNDGKIIGEDNVHPSIVGMVVDYLSRYLALRNIKNDRERLRSSFQISLYGYEKRVELLGHKIVNMDQKEKVDAESLLSQIKGLDDKSIVSACKLVTYDVWFRNSVAAPLAKGPNETQPDLQTINNIRVLVERCIKFWQSYGPVVEEGYTFENDGYTDVVDSGDGDYLTKDTMWDLKVSKTKPTNKHTLQLLMYWVMGLHSKKPMFKGVTKIGIFNPRLNVAYVYDMGDVSKDVLRAIEKEVICYK